MKFCKDFWDNIIMTATKVATTAASNITTCILSKYLQRHFVKVPFQLYDQCLWCFGHSTTFGNNIMADMNMLLEQRLLFHFVHIESFVLDKDGHSLNHQAGMYKNFHSLLLQKFRRMHMFFLQCYILRIKEKKSFTIRQSLRPPNFR